MPDDDGIIIAGGDPAAELFSGFRLEVLFGRHKDVGRGIEPQELRGPLIGQMVRHDKDRLAAQAETLAFHGGGDHFKGFACTDLVGQHGVSTVDHMSDGVFLMFPQRDLRVHPGKDKMAAVILAGAGAVHQLVILLDQLLPALRIFPDPVLKSVLDGLLLLRSQRRFF